MSSNNEKTFEESNRIIYVNGIFNEQKAEKVVTKLLQYDCEDPGKDILMFIDSYGGVIDSFIAIHDIMRLLKSPVATVCVGKAMSCGQMLLISGAKGKRFITPNSRVLIHELSGGAVGKLTDMEIDYKEAQRMQKEVIEKLILKYTNITSKKIKDIMQRDTFFNAKESLELGLVDAVINNSNTLYKRLSM